MDDRNPVLHQVPIVLIHDVPALEARAGSACYPGRRVALEEQKARRELMAQPFDRPLHRGQLGIGAGNPSERKELPPNRVNIGRTDGVTL